MAFPTRQARTVNVEYSPEEMEFYNAVTDFVEKRFIADWDSAQGISFARIMPQRQVASCIPAMRSYLKDQAAANTLLRPRDWEGDDISEHTNGRARVGIGEQEAAKRLLGAMDKLGSRDTKFAQFLGCARESGGGVFGAGHCAQGYRFFVLQADSGLPEQQARRLGVCQAVRDDPRRHQPQNQRTDRGKIPRQSRDKNSAVIRRLAVRDWTFSSAT